MEIVVPSRDLERDIAHLEARGFRLDVIAPADAPRRAEMSGHGLTLSLDTTAEIQTPAPERVEFSDALTLARGGEWGDGRAGMQYRDLIPDRHGGHVIASHIRIPVAGPVPDYVHHHDVDFQVIFVRKGRVQVVYEDQGGPFWMEEGDVVLQPPHIRHRVLASEGGCEVIEVASPAEHPTFVEHEVGLPTAVVDSERDFGGQRFCFSRAADAEWADTGSGWLTRTSGIAAATSGVGSVRVHRIETEGAAFEHHHDGTLCLALILDGNASLLLNGARHHVGVDDSFAVPSGSDWALVDAEPGTTVLHVAMA